MQGKNKAILLIGLICLGVAFFAALIALYFSGQHSSQAAQQIAALEVQLANLMNAHAQDRLPAADAQRVKRDTIALDDFLVKAHTIYGPEERRRTEGVLWIDRKGSAYVITLGAVHGLQRGSTLNIFDGSARMGQVAIETPLDIISYVTPVGMSANDFSNDYYRVEIRSPR